MEGMPEYIIELMKRIHGPKNEKYSAELRTFAITLLFYSSRAYRYVRRVYNSCLPAPSTVRKWMQVIDGSPGLTAQSFNLLKLRAQQLGHRIPVTLVHDEMSIRQQTLCKNGQIYGKVDIGAQAPPQDNAEEATNAWVFMVVSLKLNWKLPVAYYLVKGLGANERANILNQVLRALHESSCDAMSVTFDGTHCNYSTLEQLGASFTYPSTNFKPFILHPSTKKFVYAFPDPSHCIKLVRNAFGNQPYLQQGSETIQWRYICSLQSRQEKEELHLANKLTKKHINYNDNVMNVSLAAQVLSQSVANALQKCRELDFPEFQGSEETQKYCETFNTAFDLLNTRSKYSFKCSKPYSKPLDRLNYSQMKLEADRIIEYIENLEIAFERKRTTEGVTNVIYENKFATESRLKAGFLGFVISLQNMFHIFDALQSSPELNFSYLLTLKLSQDHLESFFSAVRSRGGHNNNPNAYQFETAYKHLLMHNEVTCSENANVKILQVSSSSKERINPKIDIDVAALITEIEDEFEDEPEPSEPPETEEEAVLTTYVKEVVVYISGFVARAVRKKLYKKNCTTCMRFLVQKNICEANEYYNFLKLKNRGGLTMPSEDVVMLCMEAEKFLRLQPTTSFPPSHFEDMMKEVLRKVKDLIFLNRGENEDDHAEDNHVLVNLILSSYYNIRRHYILTVASMKNRYSRRKLTKLVLFNHE